MIIFKQFMQKIHEINQRYAVPKAEMSSGVKFALTGLRIYLFVLVLLLLYKFITVIPAGK